MTWSRLAMLAVVCTLSPVLAAAQDPAPAAQVPDDPDLDPNRSQPDFTLVNLQTTLRLPRYKSAFRVTHRFTRPLGDGDFGDLVSDLFGLDSGAQIGLEYRFGFMRGLQGGIYRTSNRTIQFFAQYSALQQARAGIGLDVVGTIDGTDNFSDSYSPAIGVVVSRELGSRGAIYVQPMWVNNSNPLPGTLVEHNDTVLLGLSARIRIRPTVYVLGEYIPRFGYAPGVHHGTFAIEKRAGGHVFQFNFSNSTGSTMGQLAQGGTDNDDWYIGFNISRRFF